MTLLDRYGTVLRGTGAARPLAASIVGRLSLGMTGLALLLLVRAETGSYAAAGAVSGAYAVSFGVFSPARARSADRKGPVGVLLVTGVLHPLALVAVVALSAGGAPTAAVGAAAVLAGASVPPLGAVMRALWGRLVDGARLTTAFALESVVIEICFVVGPLLVAVLAATSGPASAVVVSGLLTLVGSFALARTPTVAQVPVSSEETHVLGPLTAPVVRALLATSLAVGAGFGAVELSMPAFVESVGGRPAAAGVLLAVWSAGSMAGGLVYGAVHPQAPHVRQLPWLVGALAGASALPLLGVAAGAVLGMAVALLAYGVTIAPLGACNSVLLSGSAPAGTTTEAFAWNSSAIFGGAALGSAAAGVLVDRAGVGAALGVTAVAGGVVLVLGLRAAHRLGRAA